MTEKNGLLYVISVSPMVFCFGVRAPPPESLDADSVADLLPLPARSTLQPVRQIPEMQRLTVNVNDLRRCNSASPGSGAASVRHELCSCKQGRPPVFSSRLVLSSLFFSSLLFGPLVAQQR